MCDVCASLGTTLYDYTASRLYKFLYHNHSSLSNFSVGRAVRIYGGSKPNIHGCVATTGTKYAQELGDIIPHLAKVWEIGVYILHARM